MADERHDADAPVSGPDEATPKPILEAMELGPRCLALLESAIRTGDSIIIARRGRPIARLQPLARPGEEEEDQPVWDLEAIGP
jgi:hypothetical protein